MPTAVRAIRGATTVEEDTAAQITERIGEVLLEMLDANGISKSDIISILFTGTDDITALFPAAGAREFGFGTVPLMCAREMLVEGAKPLCMRVMMHVNTDTEASGIKHVYLHDAIDLRDDL